MLLRRVIEHVKAQNWTAVTLDFVIVLFGVLLAFQITEWNEDRVANAVRSAALDRLLAESEQAVVYLRGSVHRFEEANESRFELLTRLTEDNWRGVDLDQMTLGIVTMGRMPAVAPPRSAYDEIIASGLFAEIGDVTARESVTEYYASIDYLNGMSEYLRTLSQWHSYWESESISDIFSPEDPYQTKTIVDLDKMRADQELEKMLVLGNRSQLALTDWWRAALTNAETMCMELARISNRGCAVLEASE